MYVYLMMDSIRMDSIKVGAHIKEAADCCHYHRAWVELVVCGCVRSNFGLGGF
jgi:hypothetical protein